ncbi:SRPBCC family protein [Microbispora sp. NPDC049125]|uniref:SRPBCC family protein n=1 Tax=Microbispora sp. NPDC049125 TaxID=3154929 RepID=UPI003466B81F
MTRTIDTTTVIDAPPGQVWEVIADFARYPEWNPFVREISGPLVPGERLTVRIASPGGKSMTFQPRLLTAEPGRALRWKGTLALPRLFDGVHEFLIGPEGAGTRLVHRETFSGLLVPFGGGTIRGARAGFEQLNTALKRRVEERSSR